jgi:hypothetical protein
MGGAEGNSVGLAARGDGVWQQVRVTALGWEFAMFAVSKV